MLATDSYKMTVAHIGHATNVVIEAMSAFGMQTQLSASTMVIMDSSLSRASNGTNITSSAQMMKIFAKPSSEMKALSTRSEI